jgi:2-polyprenyl-3-methyl-5-hydroxy-6-metoxy-1,4-benzoquinol methylase
MELAMNSETNGIERITPDNSAEWQLLGIQHLQRYEFASRLTQGKSVLDLACGNGYGAYTLANLGAGNVMAVDLDADAIEYAKAHYSGHNVRYFCEDCFEVRPQSGGVDVITSFETIEHLDEPKRFVHHMRELIAPEGCLIISAPNTLRYKRAARPVLNSHHLSEPTYDEFREWVETAFVIKQQWEQTPIATALGCQSALVERSALVRWMVQFELLLKRLARRPSLPSMLAYTASQEMAPRVFTQIFPLLPERRAVADVFIFICEPR